MKDDLFRYPRRQVSRREIFRRTGAGFGGLALIDLLSRNGAFAAPANETANAAIRNPLAAKPPHFATKAKHVVFLFMNGAPSHLDTFDYKPALSQFDGQPYRGDVKEVGSNGRPVGHLMQSPFEFKQHGQSGLWISSLYPHLAEFADDLCVVRSVHTDTAAHASGCLQMNTGSVQIGKPSLGSWLSYGLGTLQEDLPSFVVMADRRGGPVGGASNWSSGFMPASYQGTLFRSAGSPLLDLETPEGVSEQGQRKALDLLRDLNEKHLEVHPGESELAARIASYELAYRMQTSAAEAVNLQAEDPKTRQMYGLENERTADFGTKCLITRRLLERGVRFIQLYSGGGDGDNGNWDGHDDCVVNHQLHASETDQPIAALIADLKRTGLFEETLLVWGGEFGRTPTSEGVGKRGRDHNWLGFTMWLAGAGVAAGRTVGATDELGFKAVEDPIHISDLHATILHLMGLDHKRLTYFYHGLDERITGQRGLVAQKVLA